LATPGFQYASFTEVADPNGLGVGILNFHEVKGDYVVHQAVQVAGFTATH
jgi:hypothetical protein